MKGVDQVNEMRPMVKSQGGFENNISPNANRDYSEEDDEDKKNKGVLSPMEPTP